MKYLMTLFLILIYITVSPLSFISADNRMGVPLRQGVLLIATPKLEDPNFIHTVILLVSYGREGSLGLIINRPSGIDLKKIFPYLEGIEERVFPIYLGGPVERMNMSILFVSDTPPKGVLRVSDNLYFTHDKDIMIPVLQHRNSNDKVRVYAGFAGWGHGQLEHEIMQGIWTTMESDQETVFTKNPFKIWPSIFKVPTEDNLVRLNIPESVLPR